MKEKVRIYAFAVFNAGGKLKADLERLGEHATTKAAEACKKVTVSTSFSQVYKEDGVAPDGQLCRSNRGGYIFMDVSHNTGKMLISIAYDAMRKAGKDVGAEYGAFAEIVVNKPGHSGKMGRQYDEYKSDIISIVIINLLDRGGRMTLETHTTQSEEFCVDLCAGKIIVLNRYYYMSMYFPGEAWTPYVIVRFVKKNECMVLSNYNAKCVYPDGLNLYVNAQGKITVTQEAQKGPRKKIPFIAYGLEGLKKDEGKRSVFNSDYRLLGFHFSDYVEDSPEEADTSTNTNNKNGSSSSSSSSNSSSSSSSNSSSSSSSSSNSSSSSDGVKESACASVIGSSTTKVWSAIIEGPSNKPKAFTSIPLSKEAGTEATEPNAKPTESKEESTNSVIKEVLGSGEDIELCEDVAQQKEGKVFASKMPLVTSKQIKPISVGNKSKSMVQAQVVSMGDSSEDSGSDHDVVATKKAISASNKPLRFR
jgi:hypothetical protein